MWVEINYKVDTTWSVPQNTPQSTPHHRLYHCDSQHSTRCLFILHITAIFNQKHKNYYLSTTALTGWPLHGKVETLKIICIIFHELPALLG
jgi:hypothetical protein